MKIKSPNLNVYSEVAVGGYIFVNTWHRLNVKILKNSENMQYHIFYNVTNSYVCCKYGPRTSRKTRQV